MSRTTSLSNLDQKLCFALYSASMAVNRAYKPTLDKLKITYPQYLVLSALWESDGKTVGAIAQRLALEPSTVTPLVKRLEAAGFITRARNLLDERQVFVNLTKAGKSMQERSTCLGETLFKAAGLSQKEFKNLNQDILDFREAITTSTSSPTPGTVEK